MSSLFLSVLKDCDIPFCSSILVPDPSCTRWVFSVLLSRLWTSPGLCSHMGIGPQTQCGPLLVDCKNYSCGLPVVATRGEGAWSEANGGYLADIPFLKYHVYSCLKKHRLADRILMGKSFWVPASETTSRKWKKWHRTEAGNLGSIPCALADQRGN